MTETLQADVVVVGAGFAGLTAALRLTQQKHADGRPLSVLVLEARDRVGGRVFTKTMPDGTWLDLGGTWLGPSHHHARGLAAEMGVETYPTYDQGDFLFVLPDGNVVRHVENFPADVICPGLELAAAMAELEAMADQVPLDAPWQAPKAREWDAQTCESWAARLDEPMAGLGVRTIWRGVFCCDPAEVSLLDFLYLLRSHEGFVNLMSTTGGDQQDRVEGGAQAIANQVAIRLGDRVHLRTAVRRIVQTEAGVEVVAEGLTVKAQRVVLALPATLVGRLDFEPQLPHERRLLYERVPLGSVIKVLVAYDLPFWRTDGLNGQSFSTFGPVGATFDGCSNRDPDGKGPGLLIAFAFGPHADEVGRLSPANRRQAFLDALVARFGDLAAAPKLYEEIQWADEVHTGGGMFAHLPTGVWTRYGHLLHQPLGRIHFAGTETSAAGHGSINGAVESGERAAKEVLAAL